MNTPQTTKTVRIARTLIAIIAPLDPAFDPGFCGVVWLFWVEERPVVLDRLVIEVVSLDNWVVVTFSEVVVELVPMKVK